MKWEEMGYIFFSENITKPFMKLKDKGGFSSKLRVESLIE